MQRETVRQELVEAPRLMTRRDRWALFTVRVLHTCMVIYMLIATVLAYLGFRLRANNLGILGILMLMGTVIANAANRNRCPLTQLENHILRKYDPKAEYRHFSNRLFERLGINLPGRFWDAALYLGYGGAALLGFIR